MSEKKEDEIKKALEESKIKELDKNIIENHGKKIIGAEITEEMQSAYIDYAMSVIVSRAIPSVEDGLKPVQRRILYSMYEMGLQPNKLTKKSARIVGDVLGKFHPHGDLAVYDALVRMAQDFSLRYPLISGQGNFGSLDGDPPAAMRYTEAKLAEISLELLNDIDKNTVSFVPNFDNSMKEPANLPAKLPNLLINGATGIAVGMATNIPPHNLVEVCDAAISYINNPEITIEQLTQTIKGPDFPTGGQISGDIEGIYKTGNGKLIVRGRTMVEDAKGGKQNIIITEIPYMVNKSDLITQIAKLCSEKKLPDVLDIRDESAKGKIRIVIELRRGADSKFTLNRLYKFTRLQDSFDVNMLALVNNKPQLLNLKQLIENYVNYRKLIITKRTQFELKKAQERLEIVQGLLKALKNLDNVIKTIKESKAHAEAHASLRKKFDLSDKQASAILEMRLSSLTALEQKKLNDEEKKLEDTIKELNKILGDVKEVLSIIKKDLSELKRKFGDDRKTQIIGKVRELTESELVEKKEVVVTITEKGYAKRMDLKAYKEQKRGGKGVIGSDLSMGDFVRQLIVCSTHDYLLFFTEKGKAYCLKAHQIPETERYAKGKALINLLSIKDEKIQSVLPVSEFKNFIIIVTSNGIVKKINLSILSKIRSSGIRAINLPADGSDTVIDVKPVMENQEILLVTKEGQAIRFNSNEVRPMGRASYGITGIKLEDNDKVVSLEVLPIQKDKTTILTITENGYGKRSDIEDYRLTGRAGKGVINLKVSDKTGHIVSTVSVKDADSAIVTTAKGMVIRTPVKEIRVMGRATQGVRIVKLGHDDKVVDLVKVEEAE